MDGLDAIPWSQLTHAHGQASDVPGLLRALVSTDEHERAQARSELFGNIWHQGTVYAATARAVPFLVELAVAPGAPGRPEVLGLLGAIAESNDGPRGAHTEVVRRTASITGLLRDGDPLVRAGAAYVLGTLSELAPTIAPQLRAAADREGDALARAGILLGLGSLRDASPENLAWLERRFLAREDEREGLATAVALARVAREATPESVITFLASACRDPAANSSRFEGLCWDMAAETMPREALVAAGAAAQRALPILVEALATTDDGVAASFLLEDALALAFGAKPPDRAPVALEGPQRMVLEAAAGVPIIWDRPSLFTGTLGHYRLPTSREELLVLLGRADAP